MVLNATSGNLYNVEQTCKDLIHYSENSTTVFAVYDMCKDLKSNYPEFSLMAIKYDVETTDHGRGTGSNKDNGLSYWHMAGAESLGVVGAISVLAREILERM